MSFVRIKDVSNFDGQEITIKGWVYNKRSSGKLHFLQIPEFIFHKTKTFIQRSANC